MHAAKAIILRFTRLPAADGSSLRNCYLITAQISTRGVRVAKRLSRLLLKIRKMKWRSFFGVEERSNEQAQQRELRNSFAVSATKSSGRSETYIDRAGEVALRPNKLQIAPQPISYAA